MVRYEHSMIEWYWSPPPNVDPATFRPSFTVFSGSGRSESHQGGNAELTAYLSKLGQSGWRVTTAVHSANWILWTLEREVG